ncbi:MAG: vWA domain-containing protein [Candidatus Kariarchaeaceae archaeon]|jgi:Mg-chelatase subunit ChlD
MSDQDEFDLEFDDLDDFGDDFITMTVKELVLVVYDASGSMRENGTSGQPKYKEAELATNGFVNRLQQSRAAASFSIAVAIFSDDVSEVLAPISVADLPDEEPVQLPRPKGNTNLDAGLEWAEEVAQKYMEETDEMDSDKKKVAIVILSDGKVNRGQDPTERGKRLANMYTVGAGAFGQAAEDTLKELVTSPDLFKKDPTPDDLRNLLERSSRIALRQ